MELTKIATLLVDDDHHALKRMRALLDNFPAVEILGEFQQAKPALQEILKGKLDMVFLDIEMPDMSGLEMAEAINKNCPDTKVIFTTSYDHYAIKAIKQDAFDYLLKPIDIEELQACLDKYMVRHQSNLSHREYEIIRLVAQGYNSKQIGDQLFLSRHTVDTHRRKILEKTGCKNAAELIKYAVYHKLA